ncbi:ribonuclease-3 family protein [Ruminococcaceae bacterium FB2012]|nr:ribonuclease-3 family protein [Ruminococcaceae bacterium FB2012]
MTEKELSQYSPLTLAFMGDAVYETLVREKIVSSANMPVRKLHDLTIEKVCAEFQASAVKRLLEKGLLTEEEQEIFRHGRNAGGVTAPKHSTVGEYRAATGLECLFGFLHLSGRTDRIREIFELIWQDAVTEE